MNRIAERDADEDEGSPHVGLLEDEHGRDGEDDEDGSDHPSWLVELVDPPSEQIRGEHRHGQLHQLGGLELQLTDTDPPRRASRSHAEVWHQHDDQKAHRDDEERQPDAPPPPVVEAGDKEQHCGTDRHPHHLTDEDRPG